MIEINTRIQNLKPSATLAINQKVKRLRNQGHIVYNFGFGQSPFTIHQKIVAALIDNADNNDYLPSTGLPELKENISSYLKKYHRVVANPKYIYIGPGSKELLYQTILMLEGVFLIPQGSWVSYLPQVKSKGGKYAILKTPHENNYKVTADILLDYCANNFAGQKNLILNSPNNPTGAVYSAEELKSLSEVCKEHNIIVLSDEIYSLLSFQNGRSSSIGEYYPKKTIVFGGLSKIFSAGGYRLGFMALPQELKFMHENFSSLFSETFSAVASPIQYAACEAFSLKKEVLEQITTNTAILKTIGHYVFNELEGIGVKCTQPQGGFYIMVDFEKYRALFAEKQLFTSKEIANYLLEYGGIALLPGSDFYYNENTLNFRLAYVDFDGKSATKGFSKNHVSDQSFIEQYCPNIYHGLKQLKSILKKM
ncbi:aminotransferase class I/II-fold pyridoxal phosphate-dependent enzyme [Muricauda sp. JGD-17]|uniref:Aminotransferase n=1 Tax=Flagellimonas ochracea TaxID=2696472 RepID=A0A964TDZ7_9FLAO|nr:aminotransferase class I/II-fold pyridoxal phosphate-dependent enzyme [Allomuricauda ochracea]NAY92238.1 aminotransferase class I/II-fold pyridoxal phosphate-dependent enzyme [Allomuricauda ochracea]